MRQVALISQTLRASHCHAWMDDGGGEPTILTSSPSVFSDFDFAVPPRVIPVSPLPEILTTTRLTGSRIFQRALRKARVGSRSGAWLERTIKRFAWRLRSLDQLVPSRKGTPSPQIDADSIRASAMYVELQREHGSRPIDRLVVFDVFDLPVALIFAEDHDIELLVR